VSKLRTSLDPNTAKAQIFLNSNRDLFPLHFKCKTDEDQGNNKKAKTSGIPC
jgi:hypothetical protein